jgi:hypothetical protein
MPLYKTRNNVIPENSRMQVIAKASTATLTAAESGSVITTEGAGGAIILTTPAVAAGLHYWIVNAEDQDLTITAGGTDTMVTFNDVEADSVAYATSNEKVGGGAFIVSDGTKWMVFLMTYDANDQAVTVAT